MRLDKRFTISILAVLLLAAAAFYVFAGEQRRDSAIFSSLTMKCR